LGFCFFVVIKVKLRLDGNEYIFTIQILLVNTASLIII